MDFRVFQSFLFRLFLARGAGKFCVRLFMVVWALLVICSPLVEAGGRLVLTPEIGFFSISGTDTSTDATAVVSSVYNWGITATWFQPLRGSYEGFLRAGLKSFGMAAPSNATVLNAQQTFAAVALGFRRPMGRRLVLSAYLDLNQYLLLQSASINTINLATGRWPGIGIGLDFLLFRIRTVQFLIALNGGGALPIDSPGYGIKLYSEGRATVAFSVRRLGVMIGPYARLQTVSSSIITQAYAELGVTALVGFTFGRRQGRYMFSFSPRK